VHDRDAVSQAVAAIPRQAPAPAAEEESRSTWTRVRVQVEHRWQALAGAFARGGPSLARADAHTRAAEREYLLERRCGGQPIRPFL